MLFGSWENMCLEKVRMFEKISLSYRKITRQVKEMIAYIENMFAENSSEFNKFSQVINIRFKRT